MFETFSSNPFKFFDTFGLIVFTFLIIDAIIDLNKKKTRNWRVWIRLIIGILGLLVDTSLVLFVELTMFS